MQHDAWFFIGVFVFIFLVWIAAGGPMNAISFTGPRLALPEELGGGSYLQFPRSGGGGGSRNVSLPGSTGNTSGTKNTGTYSIPVSGGTISVFGVPSPYQNLVRLNRYVSSASSSDPKREYVEISLAQNASEGVNITGWYLESGATGKAELIPKGTRRPTSGVVNASDDIVLMPGERALIISGESPVGASFRENKCTGYFADFQSFSPSLPKNCPSPASELATYYGKPYIHDPACIEFVNRVPRCSVPLDGTSNLTINCKDFLEDHFNYNGCVKYHGNDSDFSGTTWRIYLGRDTHMWRSKYEIVRLHDKTGKTVDLFGY